MQGHLDQRLQKLTHAFSQRPLGGSRIAHDLRPRTEAQGYPAAKIVLRLTRVSLGGKCYPGGVHGVSELLRRVGSKKRLSPIPQRIEDEGNLKPMARAKDSVELQ